jgi:small nuclear ribonucleoprotein E
VVRSNRDEKMATKVQRIMTQPINLIFRFLQTKARVQIWLFESLNGDCIEGQIVGFDEYMNLVLDDAEEVSKKKVRTKIGRILLKGDNVTMMVKVDK